jgi:hypothetical protein
MAKADNMALFVHDRIVDVTAKGVEVGNDRPEAGPLPLPVFEQRQPVAIGFTMARRPAGMIRAKSDMAERDKRDMGVAFHGWREGSLAVSRRRRA